MEFDEMKKIWDEQNKSPLYAFDESALHKQVIKKNINIAKMTRMSEWALFGIMLVMSLVYFVEGVIDHEYYQIPGSIFMGMAAVYILWDRAKRIKHSGTSDNTILGDIEQALRTVDYHIQRQRNFLWWFIMPVVAAVVSQFIFIYSGKHWWLWLIVFGSFVVGHFRVKYEIKTIILPKKADLESLKKLVVEPANS